MRVASSKVLSRCRRSVVVHVAGNRPHAVLFLKPLSDQLASITFSRNIASRRCSADCGSSDGVDLDKGLENPSRDQAKQDERAQAKEL